MTVEASPLYQQMRRSFAACHGIPVCAIGEDDVVFVALGHHPPKQALQAFNVEARRLGWADMLDAVGAHDGALGKIERAYAVVRDRCDEALEDDHDPDCSECAEIREASWWLDWDEAADTPGAFPVTIGRS